MSDVKRFTCVGGGDGYGLMIPDRDGSWILAMDWDAMRAERDEWKRKATLAKVVHFEDAARLVRLEGAIEDFLDGKMQGNVSGLRQAWEATK